jgi:oxygen-dependent protoporphyrinogen oxidase
MRVKRVAVIGGGISGLTVAHQLEPYARSGRIELHLFEAKNVLGGVIQTDRDHGAILEGGPDSLVRRKPEAADLCRTLGLGSHLIGTNPKARGSYIFHRGRLHPIPNGVIVGVPTDVPALWQSGLLSWRGKLRASLDLVLPARRPDGDQGLGELLSRRFGHEVVRVLAEPMLSGIYAGRADLLSTAATFPQLLEMQSHARSLILAHRRAKAHAGPEKKPESPFLTLDGGLYRLIEALAGSLEASLLHLSLPVQQVNRVKPQIGDSDAPSWRLDFSHGQSLTVDAVVSALPAYQTAEFVRPLTVTAAELLAGIEYANLAVAVAIFDPRALRRPLDRTGFLVPQGEGLEMTACTWVESKWGVPAPAGIPLRVFFGRAGGEDVTQWSDAKFREVLGRELRVTMGIDSDPTYLRIFRWPRAMPQYAVGHPERMWQVRQLLADIPGFFAAGSAWQGVGVPDCVRQAQQTADSVRAYLQLPE